MISSQELEKRLHEFGNFLQDEMKQYMRTSIDLTALRQLSMPKKSHQKVVFTDYYKIPDTENKCDVNEDNTPIHKSLLCLAEFSQKENSFIDSQRIPLNTLEFFTSIDHDKAINYWKNPVQICKLKQDVLKILRDLLKISAPISAAVSDGTDCSIPQEPLNELSELEPSRLSTSTCDSQEPPVKFQPTSHHSTSKFEKSQHVPKFSSTLRFNNQPISFSNLPARMMPEPKNGRIPAENDGSTFRNVQQPVKVPQQESSTLSEAVNNVQCPQCYHQFLVHPNSSNSQLSDMRTSLTPYVNSEMEHEIYQSHFNYISSCVERIQSRQLHNRSNFL